MAWGSRGEVGTESRIGTEEGGYGLGRALWGIRVGLGMGGSDMRSLYYYIEGSRACNTRLMWGGQVGTAAQCHLFPGREVSPAHQYALAGSVSFPFFWLAGAGSAVFWVLGE